MSSSIDVDNGSEQHAVVCRDTLDGRVSIEHQTRHGSRICDTELVAVVAPAEATFRVQQVEQSLETNANSHAVIGKQTQVLSGGS